MKTKKGMFLGLFLLVFAAMVWSAEGLACGHGHEGCKCHGNQGEDFPHYADCECRPGHCECGPGHWMMKGEAFFMKIGKFVDKLDLTSDQKSRIKLLRAAFAEKIAPLMETIRTLKDQVVNELRKSNYDRKRVSSWHEEMKRIKSEMMTLHFNLVLDIYDILTGKQRESLWKMVEVAKEKRQEKRIGSGKGPAGAR